MSASATHAPALDEASEVMLRDLVRRKRDEADGWDRTANKMSRHKDPNLASKSAHMYATASRERAEASAIEVALSALTTAPPGEHPGATALRELFPDQSSRIGFIAMALPREWYAPLLVRAVNLMNTRPVNITPQQAADVRAFIESARLSLTGERSAT